MQKEIQSPLFIASPIAGIGLGLFLALLTARISFGKYTTGNSLEWWMTVSLGGCIFGSALSIGAIWWNRAKKVGWSLEKDFVGLLIVFPVSFLFLFGAGCIRPFLSDFGLWIGEAPKGKVWRSTGNEHGIISYLSSLVFTLYLYMGAAAAAIFVAKLSVNKWYYLTRMFHKPDPTTPMPLTLA